MRVARVVLLSAAGMAVACASRGPGAGAVGPEPECGNAIVEGDEACDEGLFNSDTGLCTTACAEQACGDGFVGSDEVCDDGNDVEDDACTSSCTPPNQCPNGHLDAGEDCDDGNDDDEDACLPGCVAAACGDGVVRLDVLDAQDTAFEACDDGVFNSDFAADACRSDCHPARCGDGVIDKDEECDDGAANSDTTPDACRTTCDLPRCGDTVVDTDETCDDGTANSDTAPDACRTDCAPARCGDGVDDSADACDTAGDSLACDADCTAPACGDGHANPEADPAEDCDDAAESETCDADCTTRTCGDGTINVTAGEECEADDVVANGACSIACKLVCAGFWENCTAAPGCETDTQTSGEHCGACGHDCGGGACVAGACQPLKIADLGTVSAYYSLKLYEGDLFVRSTAGLEQVAADSSALTTPVVHPNVTPAFRGYVVKDRVAYLFKVGAAGTTGIYTAPLDPPSATPVFLVETDFMVTMETDGQRLYWAANVDDTVQVQRLLFGSTDIEPVGTLPVPGPGSLLPGFDMAINTSHVYTMQIYSNSTEIWRVEKNGDPTPTYVSNNSSSISLALDGEWVYWPAGADIHRVSADPYACLPDPICPSDAFSSSDTLDVASDGLHLYWVESAGKVRRKGLVTGDAEDFVSSTDAEPTAIEVDGQFVYWLEIAYPDPTATSGPGALWKARK